MAKNGHGVIVLMPPHPRNESLQLPASPVKAQSTNQVGPPPYGIGAQILRDIGVTKCVCSPARKMPSMTGALNSVTGFVTSPSKSDHVPFR